MKLQTIMVLSLVSTLVAFNALISEGDQASKPGWLLVVGEDVPAEEVQSPAARDLLHPPHPRTPPNNFTVQVDGWSAGSEVLEYYSFPGKAGLQISEGKKKYRYSLTSSSEDPLTLRVWSGGKLIYWKGKGNIINVDTGEEVSLPLTPKNVAPSQATGDVSYRGVKGCGEIEVEVTFIYDRARWQIRNFESLNRCVGGGTNSLWDPDAVFDVKLDGSFYYETPSGTWVRGKIIGADGSFAGTFSESPINLMCREGNYPECTEWVASPVHEDEPTSDGCLFARAYGEHLKRGKPRELEVVRPPGGAPPPLASPEPGVYHGSIARLSCISANRVRSRDRPLRCLSRMRGNSHVRFLLEGLGGPQGPLAYSAAARHMRL